MRFIVVMNTITINLQGGRRRHSSTPVISFFRIANGKCDDRFTDVRLRLNVDKTDYVQAETSSTILDPYFIEAHNTEIRKVEKFEYLGSRSSTDGDPTAVFSVRINSVWLK